MIDVAIAPYDGRSSSPGRQGVEKIRRPHVEQSDARSDQPDTNHRHFSGGFEAIAHAAIDRDLRVIWITLEALTATIARSRIDASTGKVVERIVRSELIVVDDNCCLPRRTRPRRSIGSWMPPMSAAP
jgi:hypothetical protein